MKKKLNKKEAGKVLGKMRKAIKAGRVEICNPAFHDAQAQQKDSMLAWVVMGGKSGRRDVIGVDYSISGLGFGGFVFELVPHGKPPMKEMAQPCKLKMVDSECMSREFVKNVLCRMVDEAEWDTDEKEAFKHDGKA